MAKVRPRIVSPLAVQRGDTVRVTWHSEDSTWTIVGMVADIHSFTAPKDDTVTHTYVTAKGVVLFEIKNGKRHTPANTFTVTLLNRSLDVALF